MIDLDLFSFIDVSKDEFEKALMGNIPKKPPFFYAPVREFIRRGGKRIRPLLVFLSAKAVGGDERKAMDIAVAIELFHTFSLIHDDIMDCSTMRRGRPTLHIFYGTPIAINMGDGLYTLVWKCIQRVHEKSVGKIFLESFLRVVEGQATELEWYRKKRFDVSEREYLSMIGGKTAALISASCELGGLIGGGTEKQIKALKNFGYNLGIAFQIKDDLLNIVGSKEEYKKEIGGDIREGKRSLLTIHTLKKATKEEKGRLIAILSNKENTPEEITFAISLIKKYKADEYAKKKINLFTMQAMDCVKGFPKEKDLLLVANSLLNRTC